MENSVRLGICADVHHDLIPDGIGRMTSFIGEMNREKPDFIIQLGDFCRPYDYNKPFIDIWNSFNGPKYHVFGNHDNDGGFSDEDVIRFWNSPGRYYSFDCNGFHFAVLFGNEKRPHGEVKGYPRNISLEQRQWLADDIDKTELPVVVFNHHGLDTDIDEENGAIKNGVLVRRIFERANEKAGRLKVWLSLSGHWHRDYCNVYNDIHYIQINSMAYLWLGEKHGLERYEKSVYEKYPWFKYTAPYKEPLWALMTIKRTGEINIRGKRSVYVGPSPAEMGIGIWDEAYPSAAHISDRVIRVREPL
jgi:3',5'-cyclic AMP phosphodiesterase CpdA